MGTENRETVEDDIKLIKNNLMLLRSEVADVRQQLGTLALALVPRPPKPHIDLIPYPEGRCASSTLEYERYEKDLRERQKQWGLHVIHEINAMNIVKMMSEDKSNGE